MPTKSVKRASEDTRLPPEDEVVGTEKTKQSQ